MSPKQGWEPAKRTWKLWQNSLHPKFTWKSEPFWAWWGTNGQFIKGFAHVVQPSHKHLFGEGASKKSKQVTLMVEAQNVFEMLKKACLEAPVLAFANLGKPFLLQMDVSKLGFGDVLWQKTGWWSISSSSICQLILNYSWALLLLQKTGICSTKVGNCQAVLRVPPLETVHCQDQQQSTHLHHDYSQLRCYPTSMGRVTWKIHIKHWIPEGTWQCSHGCSELSHIEAECRTVKSILDNVTVGTTKSRCSWPSIGQSWWGNTQASPGNCNSGLSCMDRLTCDWLGDHPTGGSNTQNCNWVDLWPESTGSKTPTGRWCKYKRR